MDKQYNGQTIQWAIDKAQSIQWAIEKGKKDRQYNGQ
jgi:hypothetical protein